MKKRQLTQKEIAAAVGVTHEHLNAVLKGRTLPSLKLALKIQKESRGLYRADDLRPELRELNG